MQDRPTSAELLATLAGFFEEELMPALDGPLAYRSRVAANLLRILQREDALGGAALQREGELLRGLLGLASASSPSVPLTEQVTHLNRQLVAAIDTVRVAHEQAWPALMAIARDKIAIIRPGYDAWDAREELP